MEESRKRKAESKDCPYLDTIERSVLDFDFEPICSVSLEKSPHIYACLTCGVYLRGRGPRTPAHIHSLEESHYCFVHLEKGTFHCLPDDYEIIDSSLDDIRVALHPPFTATEIQELDNSTALSRDLFGQRYLPGFSGLNNLHKTDCLNVICQSLAHVQPLRDFFLSKKHSDMLVKKVTAANKKAHVVALCFGELVRKIWSRRKFKSSIDPHTLVQALADAAPNRFKVGKQMEVGELLSILLHNLHIGTGGGRKPGSSIVHKVFQGDVQVTTRRRKPTEATKKVHVDQRAGSDDEDAVDEANQDLEEKPEIEELESSNHFLQLSLDIPEKPLFRDSDGGLVIPQEPLQNVLSKFDGSTFSDATGRNGDSELRRYQLTRLPPFLILHLQRFQSNQYKTKTKNPTIVMFPVKSLDLSGYVKSNDESITCTENEVRGMGIQQLKDLLRKHGLAKVADTAVEKRDLISAVLDLRAKSLSRDLSKYDLVANIIHDSPPDVGREGQHDPLQEGNYKCHVQEMSTKQWYEIQDLDISEIMPQQIGLSECFLLVFRRKDIS